ncbi:hypothetical protein EYF80_019286 [Liparis tanakae]|uniref:Uncharacterized protein n=1 Tax=Liparis tanakae TaxID=230148 RepID=A0A4Z2HYA4_9TELE|nr:hypothetical protein EYF80_019286 [Liparis tanakae]
MTDAPISPSALGSSENGCGGWRHLRGSTESEITPVSAPQASTYWPNTIHILMRDAGRILKEGLISQAR